MVIVEAGRAPPRRQDAAVGRRHDQAPPQQIGKRRPLRASRPRPRHRPCRRGRLVERDHQQLPPNLLQRKRRSKLPSPCPPIFRDDSREPSCCMIARQASRSISAAAPRGMMNQFFANHGWGFGMSVVTRRDQVAHSLGTYGWDGGMGTSWYADPREEMTTILLTPAAWTSPLAPNLFLDFWTSAYQSIDD